MVRSLGYSFSLVGLFLDNWIISWSIITDRGVVQSLVGQIQFTTTQLFPSLYLLIWKQHPKHPQQKDLALKQVREQK